VTAGTSHTVRPTLERALASLAAGEPLVVALDVDGTLAPIAPRPDDAVVPPATRDAIARLVRLRGVHVALVSGRAADAARRLVGVDGAWSIGNHGAECIAPGGEAYVDPTVAAFASAIDRAHDALADALGGVPGVIVEHKRWSLTVHYRLASRDDVPRVERSVQAIAARDGLRVAGGKQVLELRAPIDVHKGSAVLALLDRLGAGQPRASVLYVGDDVTDEDAFRVGPPRVFALRVGPGQTLAPWRLPSQDAVDALLAALAALRPARRARAASRRAGGAR